MKEVPGNRTGKPPVWAEVLLRTLLAHRSEDAIAGDLLEEYRASIVPAVGKFRATIWYLRQVVSFVSVADALDVAEKISGPLLWGSAVVLLGYILIFTLPSGTAIPFSTLLFLFTAIVPIAASATVIRTLEKRRSLFRMCCVGIVSFVSVIAGVLNADTFRPVIIMATFLIIATTTGFYGAWITGLVRAGVLLAVATGTAEAAVLFVTVDALNRPHPPLNAIFNLPAIAAISGTIGALLGKRFGSSAMIDF